MTDEDESEYEKGIGLRLVHGLHAFASVLARNVPFWAEIQRGIKWVHANRRRQFGAATAISFAGSAFMFGVVPVNGRLLDVPVVFGFSALTVGAVAIICLLGPTLPTPRSLAVTGLGLLAGAMLLQGAVGVTEYRSSMTEECTFTSPVEGHQEFAPTLSVGFTCDESAPTRVITSRYIETKPMSSAGSPQTGLRATVIDPGSEGEASAEVALESVGHWAICIAELAPSVWAELQNRLYTQGTVNLTSAPAKIGPCVGVEQRAGSPNETTPSPEPSSFVAPTPAVLPDTGGRP